MNLGAEIWQAVTVCVAAVFTQNILLAYFLGLCPFIGVSREVKTAFGLGVAVIFVMTLTSIITWAVYEWVLVPCGITYLYIIAFILVIASFVQLVEMFLQKSVPALYRALGIYLPLITTNCAVLGVAILNIQKDFSLVKTLVHSTSHAVGFSLALILMAGIRERLESADIPKCMEGVPISLVTASLMSIAFLGFSGLI